MAVLVFALLLVTVVASFAETYALATYKRYVRGSHGRYIWRTAYILLAWVVILFSVALALLDLVGGDALFAAIWFAIAAMRAIQLYFNRDSDDDDWFTKRGHKIWAGAKRRLRRLVPTGGVRTPQPAGA